MVQNNGVKKIGLITSGGDCGGLNAILKGAASTALYMGIEPVLIPNGYAGLYNLEGMDSSELVNLSRERMSDFSAAEAGSEAGHSRVKIAAIDDPEKYDRIKRGLVKHSIDALISAGGDDSGSVVVDLNRHGIPTNHAPKTMDMDLQTYSVGGDSTANRVAQAIHDLRTTWRTHKRIGVLEVFGRYVGWSAFKGGIAGDADCIIIPEIVPDFDIIYEHMWDAYSRRVAHSDVKAGTYVIVVGEAMKGDPSKDDPVNERGFLVDLSAKPDAHGHYPLMGAGKRTVSQLDYRLKNDPRVREFMMQMNMFVPGQYEVPEIKLVRPTHLMRSGSSSAFDVNFGREVGAGAVYLLAKGITGMTVAGFLEGEVSFLPADQAIKEKPVSLDQVALYEMQGIMFGRKPDGFEAKTTKLEVPIKRFY